MFDVAEIPVSPRARNYSFYVVLFTAVLPLWSVVVASWFFAIYSLRMGRIWRYGLTGKALFAAALCEVFFSVYHYQLAKQVSGPSPFAPADTAEVQASLRRLLKSGLANIPEDGGDHESLFTERPGSPEEDITQLEQLDHRAVDFRNSLRTWFCKVPWSFVRLHDLQKWLYWSMYNVEMPPYEELCPPHRIALDQLVNLVHMRLGRQTEEGRNHSIRPMRLTIDPVRIWWRPLVFYSMVKAANWSVKAYYNHTYDARHGCHDGLEYLLRIPSGWACSASPRPLVFLHGLGLGLSQYHPTLSQLFETIADRPILIILQPHISQDIFHPDFLNPMNRHQMTDKLASLLAELGWVGAGCSDVDSETEDETKIADALPGRRRGITLLSHSNGSYTHAWVLKIYPHLVARSCFVDPVTFCSWEGDVCYNFFYRKPTTGIELLMKYFVGTELGAANLLQRHFDWVSNSLWFEEIPNARDPSKTLFVLGGKDDIVHSARVKRYLTSHGVRKNLCYDPDAKHGQALLRGRLGHREIFRWLQEPEKS